MKYFLVLKRLYRIMEQVQTLFKRSTKGNWNETLYEINFENWVKREKIYFFDRSNMCRPSALIVTMIMCGNFQDLINQMKFCMRYSYLNFLRFSCYVLVLITLLFMVYFNTRHFFVFQDCQDTLNDIGVSYSSLMLKFSDIQQEKVSSIYLLISNFYFCFSLRN